LASSYTSRPDWTHAAESAWSRIAKFQWLNRLSALELHAALGARALVPDVDGVDLRCAQGFDLDVMARTLNIVPVSVTQSFCVQERSEFLLDMGIKVLRFCPLCIRRAYHATFFQFRFVRRCPLHQVALLRGCPHCRRPIVYRLDRELLQRPYACAGCLQGLFAQHPSRRARALQSSIPAEEIASLERWRRYIGVALELNGGGTRLGVHSARRWRLPGQPQNPAMILMRRFGFLRDLQNAYAEPPPLPAYDVIKHPSVLAAMTPRGDWQSNRLPHPFKERWPHLPEDYGWYARVYRNVLNRHMRTLRAMGSPPSRKLRFSPTLRVVDRYRPELVAFMGWRLAWEGKMRPYPAKQRDSLPLLGLLEWWAFAPLRSSQVPPAVWRSARADAT
jgi:hypothetical protein